MTSQVLKPALLLVAFAILGFFAGYMTRSSPAQHSLFPDDVKVPQPLLDLPGKQALRIEYEQVHDASVDKGQTALNILRLNSVSHNLSEVDVDSLNSTQLLHTLHSYLDNIDVACLRKLRMGDIDDGGWEMCDDAGVRPVPPCIIYSFGVGHDWTFDEDASRLYGCHVYAFDPTLSLQQHDHTSMVHFFPWGVEATTRVTPQGWPMYTMADLRQKLGHQEKTVDIVKMDIEHSEWGAIPNMLTSGQLKGVKQLLIEYHVTDRINRRQALKAVQAIERDGWKRFHARKNIHCATKVKEFPVRRTACYEMMYMRIQ